MITSNLRLVVKIARRYIKRGLSHHTILDLIEEGNLGLMKAVDKFNPDLGYRFSSYAVWWIKESIESSIMNKERMVRLPVHRIKEVNRLIRQTNEIRTGLSGTPSMTEIEAVSEWDKKDIGELIQWSDGMSVRTSVMTEHTEYMSIDTCRSEAPEPVDVYYEARFAAALEKAVQSLPDLHREIVTSRYGLFGHEIKKLQCLSEVYGISKERVRQLQYDGLKKLQNKLRFDGWLDC
ncbi:sigma-70 family RNA polymerase sigma factor [Vibrio sp. ZSDZ65]|uniref:Sigma-70 family RNA polymerase sigma factor n=1 Tax=Vibrio qingdaonensis TaxID=2829491 RepID=A0A9X3HYY6_9VIBR|nr:sigma-70 family RNA polymerase sigma factor [Vibrio qingdaonensis]MCW8349056.1 sigma-70 family RNA polymerase sigma factor [Vibrio qingdaonensis]